MAKVPHFACACRLSEVVARAKAQAEKAERTGARALGAVLLAAALTRCAPARLAAPARPEAHATTMEHAAPAHQPGVHEWRDTDD